MLMSAALLRGATPCIATVLLAMSAAAVADDRSASVGRFVLERVVDAFRISAGNMSDAHKRQKLDTFLQSHFDTRRFAQLGLGEVYASFWQTKTKNGTLTEAQLAELRDIYDEHVRGEVIDYFLEYLDDVNPEQFHVVDTRKMENNHYITRATLGVADGNSRYVLEFEVGELDGQLRAFNVFSGDTNFANLIGGNETASMESEYGDPVKFLYRLDAISGWSSWYD